MFKNQLKIVDLIFFYIQISARVFFNSCHQKLVFSSIIAAISLLNSSFATANSLEFHKGKITLDLFEETMLIFSPDSLEKKYQGTIKGVSICVYTVQNKNSGLSAISIERGCIAKHAVLIPDNLIIGSARFESSAVNALEKSNNIIDYFIEVNKYPKIFTGYIRNTSSVIGNQYLITSYKICIERINKTEDCYDFTGASIDPGSEANFTIEKLRRLEENQNGSVLYNGWRITAYGIRDM